MKFRNQAVDFLTFNRAEQRGISVLLAILTGLIIANIAIPARTAITEHDFADFEKEIIAFEKEMNEAAEKERITPKSNNYKYNYYSPFKGDTVPKSKQKPAISFTIELNSTDTLELQRLKGIGPAFARRIIGYRDRLGGFYSKSQILEVFGMDSSRYRSISANITVNPSMTKKIDINNIAFKDLMRHPYFPYELTREIVLVRKKMKKFNSPDDLRSVKGMTDSTFNRISRYIEIL
jgi:DNA uptake protein ComE-like DNA-binding protein